MGPTQPTDDFPFTNLQNRQISPTNHSASTTKTRYNRFRTKYHQSDPLLTLALAKLKFPFEWLFKVTVAFQTVDEDIKFRHCPLKWIGFFLFLSFIWLIHRANYGEFLSPDDAFIGAVEAFAIAPDNSCRPGQREIFHDDGGPPSDHYPQAQLGYSARSMVQQGKY